MFREGQQLGNYTLIRKLGRGGFGEVWLAEKRAKFVTTKVAVKLPLDEQVDHEAIKQEATLWEQASGHPNVLPIIDADEYDGQIVIISEYAPDGSLEQWLRRNGKMSVEKAVETTIQILNGLEFLHSRNIIHRDLKPANILLQGDTPRLADFGISRALKTTVASQSQNISGTFAYMSPEALDGKRSKQTDIWSVGVNLYQLITGKLPYQQNEPSSLIMAIMMKDFEPLPGNIPQNLKTVIAKALAKQPENRYKGAGEMREDLRQFLRIEVVSNPVQPDIAKTQPSVPFSNIPPTQRSAPLSSQNFQNETETVVHALPTFSLEESPKSSNFLIFTIIGLFLFVAIGFGAYLLNNESNLTDIKVQNNTNSVNSVNNEKVNTLVNVNSTSVNTIANVSHSNSNTTYSSKNEPQADIAQDDTRLKPSPPKNETPYPTEKPIPKIVSGGVVNGKAVTLVKPDYPSAARTVRAAGVVNVQVTISEEGNVISASAVSGHPLLRASAEQAARQSKFNPTVLSGQPVKVVGVITYNFVP